MAKRATAIGKPDVSVMVCVNMIPIIIGNIIIAPSARNLGIIKSIPATTSAPPSNGMNHPIAASEVVSVIRLSGISSGVGMKFKNLFNPEMMNINPNRILKPNNIFFFIKVDFSCVMRR